MTNHSIRTGPQLRDDAKRALARRLAHETALDRPTPPDALAAELLVVLDGALIRLTDGRTPAPVDGTPAAALPPDNPYRAAREALKGQQQ